MRAARLLGVLILLMLPVSLSGGTLTVGNDFTSPNSGDGNVGVVRTDIARASGDDANAFKIKFFRRVGDPLTLTAERGPFTGATIQVTVLNSAGVVVRSLSHTYTANYFIQTDAATFAGGPIAGDESIQISISSGSAIVYGSTTDNITNDPAIQFVHGVFAIA